MKVILTFFLVFLLASCNKTQNGFSYDRQNACVVDYGFNGFSVIVDGDKTIVRNNRMNSMTNILSIRTATGNYKALGRYFPDYVVNNLINSISNSEKIYLEWIDNEGSSSSGAKKVHRNIIDTTDFKTKYDDCIKQQRSRS